MKVIVLRVTSVFGTKGTSKKCPLSSCKNGNKFLHVIKLHLLEDIIEISTLQKCADNGQKSMRKDTN